jgi:DNA invertase Pin-like site-specific DNA recombinase
VSGRFGADRGGFREVISRVCLGEVGAVFGLEVSRLARSSAEFTRLLELARLTDTLVIDADGVYDLCDINDRLLLGLKGSMSEALCRRRHKASYPDCRIMPTSGREPLVAPGHVPARSA